MVVRSISLGDVVAGEILDDLPVHKIVDKEKVVPEQFLQEVQLTWLIVGDDIVEDELEPFGDMHLEELILADQLVDDLVEGVVELEELVSLVVLIREDIFFQVHFHEVEQLEEELADAEVFADHLTLEHRED